MPLIGSDSYPHEAKAVIHSEIAVYNCVVGENMLAASNVAALGQTGGKRLFAEIWLSNAKYAISAGAHTV